MSWGGGRSSRRSGSDRTDNTAWEADEAPMITHNVIEIHDQYGRRGAQTTTCSPHGMVVSWTGTTTYSTGHSMTSPLECMTEHPNHQNMEFGGMPYSQDRPIVGHNSLESKEKSENRPIGVRFLLTRSARRAISGPHYRLCAGGRGAPEVVDRGWAICGFEVG